MDKCRTGQGSWRQGISADVTEICCFAICQMADNSGGIDSFSDLVRKQSVLECNFFSLLAPSSTLITQFTGTFNNINGKTETKVTEISNILWISKWGFDVCSLTLKLCIICLYPPNIRCWTLGLPQRCDIYSPPLDHECCYPFRWVKMTLSLAEEIVDLSPDMDI